MRLKQGINAVVTYVKTVKQLRQRELLVERPLFKHIKYVTALFYLSRVLGVEKKVGEEMAQFFVYSLSVDDHTDVWRKRFNVTTPNPLMNEMLKTVEQVLKVERELNEPKSSLMAFLYHSCVAYELFFYLSYPRAYEMVKPKFHTLRKLAIIANILDDYMDKEEDAMTHNANVFLKYDSSLLKQLIKELTAQLPLHLRLITRIYTSMIMRRER